MSTKAAYINGTDVTKVSDDELIASIRVTETEIASLKAIKTESSKIKAKIADAEASLAKIVEILDSRA